MVPHKLWNRQFKKLHTTVRKEIQSIYPSRSESRSEIFETLSLNPFEQQSTESLETSVRYLMKVCTAPRSLKSSCRLVISRCVKVRRQRHREVTYAQLPLSEEMKNYVMFSDFTDPDYGTDVVTTT